MEDSNKINVVLIGAFGIDKQESVKFLVGNQVLKLKSEEEECTMPL